MGRDALCITKMIHIIVRYILLDLLYVDYLEQLHQKQSTICQYLENANTTMMSLKKKVIESDEIHEKIRDVQTMQDASGQLNSLLIETNKELLPIAVSKAMKYLTLISSYLTLELEELPLDRPDPSSPVAV